MNWLLTRRKEEKKKKIDYCQLQKFPLKKKKLFKHAVRGTAQLFSNWAEFMGLAQNHSNWKFGTTRPSRSVVPLCQPPVFKLQTIALYFFLFVQL